MRSITRHPLEVSIQPIGNYFALTLFDLNNDGARLEFTANSVDIDTLTTQMEAVCSMPHKDTAEERSNDSALLTLFSKTCLNEHGQHVDTSKHHSSILPPASQSRQRLRSAPTTTSPEQQATTAVSDYAAVLMPAPSSHNRHKAPEQNTTTSQKVRSEDDPISRDGYSASEEPLDQKKLYRG